MLRQLGDYDSLFEIKVNQKEIIRWTITSAQFIDMILKYLNIEDNENNNRNKIQIINARSSKETLNDFYLETEMDLITITGVIIDRNFKLIEYVRKLLKKQGYSLFNQNNEIPNYTESSTVITVCKSIATTPYKCFLTISNTGIFRIDVVLANYRDERIKKTINTSYLEKFIHKEILEEDFQQLLSNKGKIVVGAPIVYQDEKYSKLELLVRTHEIIRSRYYRNLSMITESISDELYNDKILIIPIINVLREDEGDIYRGNLSMKFRRVTRNKENFNSSVKVIFAMLCSDSFTHEEHLGRHVDIIRRQEKTENDINIEYIKLTEDNINQILYGDQTYIKNSFKNIIESYSINKIDELIELEEVLSDENDYCDEDDKNIDELEEIAIEVIQKGE